MKTVEVKLTTDLEGYFKTETKEKVFWIILNSGPTPPPPLQLESVTIFHSHTMKTIFQHKTF